MAFILHRHIFIALILDGMTGNTVFKAVFWGANPIMHGLVALMLEQCHMRNPHFLGINITFAANRLGRVWHP